MGDKLNPAAKESGGIVRTTPDVVCVPLTARKL